MSKLLVRKYEDPVLRKQALPIEAITPEIEKLGRDMIETMILHKGVGLAGPQVGIMLRIFIIQDERVNEIGEWIVSEPEIIINPVLSKPSQEKEVMQEGCLSLPGLHVDVVRPREIHIRYQNIKGEWVEEQVTDFRARVMMHENDHLNGVLTIDRMDKKERKKVEPLLQAIDKKYHTTHI
jgi:peptide deformylase